MSSIESMSDDYLQQSLCLLCKAVNIDHDESNLDETAREDLNLQIAGEYVNASPMIAWNVYKLSEERDYYVYDDYRMYTDLVAKFKEAIIRRTLFNEMSDVVAWRRRYVIIERRDPIDDSKSDGLRYAPSNAAQMLGQSEIDALQSGDIVDGFVLFDADKSLFANIGASDFLEDREDDIEDPNFWSTLIVRDPPVITEHCGIKSFAALNTNAGPVPLYPGFIAQKFTIARQLIGNDPYMPLEHVKDCYRQFGDVEMLVKYVVIPDDIFYSEFGEDADKARAIVPN